MASKTIPQWCKSHAFSRGSFYNFDKQGKAPRTMKINACRRISDESDAEWVRAREAETAETEQAETAKTELQGGDDDD